MLCLARTQIVKLLRGSVHWEKQPVIAVSMMLGIVTKMGYCHSCLCGVTTACNFVHIISWMFHFLPTCCHNCFFFSITISHTLLALCKHCIFVVLILSQLSVSYPLIVTIGHFLLTYCHCCFIITCDIADMRIFKFVY